MSTEMWSVTGSETTTAVWIADEKGKRVCTVRNCANDLDRAHLIAAAPELLAALQKAIARQAYKPGAGPDWWAEGCAVIAKATGAQP